MAVHASPPHPPNDGLSPRQSHATALRASSARAARLESKAKEEAAKAAAEAQRQEQLASLRRQWEQARQQRSLRSSQREAASAKARTALHAEMATFKQQVAASKEAWRKQRDAVNIVAVPRTPHAFILLHSASNPSCFSLFARAHWPPCAPKYCCSASNP